MDIRDKSLEPRESHSAVLVCAVAVLLMAATARPQDTGQPAPTPAAEFGNPQAAPTPGRVGPLKYFSYVVKSGDTLTSIAWTFGIQTRDLAQANRLESGAALRIGQTLKIPNPFIAENSRLDSEVKQLRATEGTAERMLDTLNVRVRNLSAQVRDLTAHNKALTADNKALGASARVLPWWREAAYTSVIVTLILLAVTTLAVLERWRLRSRFLTVAGMNESLRRLDQKYKVLRLQAELRLQEVYGRWRQGMEDDQPRPKTPEELEIEQLDGELKKILEASVANLGGSRRRKRRAALKDLLRRVGLPIEARSARR